MQELKGADKLSRVETCSLHRETLRLLDLKHEVATIQILHHEEQVTLKQRIIIICSSLNVVLVLPNE